MTDGCDLFGIDDRAEYNRDDEMKAHYRNITIDYTDPDITTFVMLFVLGCNLLSENHLSVNCK